MKVYLYISLFTYLFSSCCLADVFYYRIPFRIQTYSPVTKSKIESLAMGNGTQKLLQKNRDELLLLLNGANGECYHFDDKMLGFILLMIKIGIILIKEGLCHLILKIMLNV